MLPAETGEPVSEDGAKRVAHFGFDIAALRPLALRHFAVSVGAFRLLVWQACTGLPRRVRCTSLDVCVIRRSERSFSTDFALAPAVLKFLSAHGCVQVLFVNHSRLA